MRGAQNRKEKGTSKKTRKKKNKAEPEQSHHHKVEDAICDRQANRQGECKEYLR